MDCSFLHSYSSFAIIDNSKYFMNRIGLIELHFTIFIIPIGIFAVIAADVFTLIVVAAIVIAAAQINYLIPRLLPLFTVVTICIVTVATYTAVIDNNTITKTNITIIAVALLVTITEVITSSRIQNLCQRGKQHGHRGIVWVEVNILWEIMAPTVLQQRRLLLNNATIKNIVNLHPLK